MLGAGKAAQVASQPNKLTSLFTLHAGEAGTGNVVEAVRHCRAVMGAIKQLQTLDEDEIYVYAKVRRAAPAGGCHMLS